MYSNRDSSRRNRRTGTLSRRIVAILLSVTLLFTGGITGGVGYSHAAGQDAVRYSVLILDTSGSMSGTPAEKQEAAAIKFCGTLLQASGENYVALVELNSSSSVVCEFTDDYDMVEENIRNMYTGGGTNINEALETAGSLLEGANAPAGAIKNIILCTDGLPESGEWLEDGRYSSGFEDVGDYYGHANYAYGTAQNLKPKASIYSLGFFHNVNDAELKLGRAFLNDIQNAGYYEVTDPDEIKFTFGDLAEDINNKEESKTFCYGHDAKTKAANTAPCYYNDAYFKRGASKYNPSLATMSLAFAMSAFGDKYYGYPKQSENAVQLLENVVGIPRENIWINYHFEQKPGMDSIGAIAGSKKISSSKGDFTLIAVAIRGGGYEREWGSNFTIGRDGQHEGFDQAANNVLGFIKNYLKSNPQIKGQVKFWITGYSRAAATANLVGGALDKGREVSSDISYGNDDVYVYCFEPPQGALTGEVRGASGYENIFNIVNKSDPVPYVAPTVLGFIRYGQNKYLPSAATTSKGYKQKLEKMLSIYNSLPSTDQYVVDNFRMKKIDLGNIAWDTTIGHMAGYRDVVVDDRKDNRSQGVFLNDYVTILARDFIGNRDNYVNNYQAEIREACKLFGLDENEMNNFMDYLLIRLADNWGQIMWEQLNPAISNQQVVNHLSQIIRQAAEDVGYDVSLMESAVNKLSTLLVELIVSHPNYFTTMVCNIEGVGAAHYPELCFAWLASMDPNYDSRNSESFDSGNYRIIRINCEVDVVVRDDNNEQVAAIVDEEPQDNGADGIISGVNENGEKYVVLPADADYRVDITAREDDYVNYGVSEYSADAGDYTRMVNYFDVYLEEDQQLQGEVPAYSEYDLEQDGTLNGSNAYYELLDEEGDSVGFPYDMCGVDATDAYYSVDVSPSNKKYGAVLGGGTYQFGSFAKVEAKAGEGAKFVGWYEDNELVSTDAEYRLCVREDHQLTAKFKSNTVTDLPKIKLLKVTKGKKSFTAKWKKPTKKNRKKMAKIQVQYSTTKKFTASKTVTKTASKNKTTLKVKKLKKGKTYYVRVRAYAKKSGVIHVSKWSKVKKVRVK